jgi:hypothetical protein
MQNPFERLRATHPVPPADVAAAPSAPQLAADRRAFLRTAGLAGGAIALAACGAGTRDIVGPVTTTSKSDQVGNVVLDFSNEIDVLNYAFALEQLEAAFYVRVVNAPQFGSIFADNERRVLVDLRDHEVAHRDFFIAALGTARIPNLTVDFSSVDFNSRASVLATARTFEDLGVGAYNGAARYLRSSVYVTVAGKIVSVEARHAAAIRDILEPRTGAFAPNAFDPALPPNTVLSAADPFIVENITVINA